VETVREPCGSELRHVELPQQDSAGGFELRNDRGILSRDKMLEYGGSARGTNPFGIELILHRKRNAVQRPAIMTSSYSVLRLAGSLSRLILTDSEISIELRIQTLYAFQVGFYDLNWGDLFLLDLSRELCDWKKR
jgi:hypothetical protein